MREVSSLFLSLVLAAAGSGAAWADMVGPKTGGAIHGEMANAGDKQSTGYEITPDGGRMTIPRSEVVRVVSQSPQQDEYHRRARAAADTVDAHLQLAEWCREQKLISEYRDELAKILELDPNHEQARRALGHRKEHGNWQSRDELMAARGLIWYDGKYYTQHHIELLDQAKAARETDADWSNQLDRWARWVHGRRKDRSDETLRGGRGARHPGGAAAGADPAA